MIQKRIYKVAEQLFAIEAEEERFAYLANYTPFQADEMEGNSLFTIHLKGGMLPGVEGWKFMHADAPERDLPRMETYRRADEWLFRLISAQEKVLSVFMFCADRRDVALYACLEDVRLAVDSAAMLLYAFCTAQRHTLLFHASVTVRNGKGFLFLGRSGTGKSTHSQLWQQAFTDAELLNDDNPVVRILPDETVRVYGSPWSGKTPCYKNQDVPVGALVMLEQAPCNAIHLCKMTQAYPYILASVIGLKLLPQMMDLLYESIAQLLGSCPVYKLECLPNLEAAQLCAQTCLS